eukprot:TRINITY_DN1126_c2_g4_i1.p1 TRINITY_DN1126_c2_g4~~TRINITY_DN1126_c2_g4_i1.p1  ORF type:complete len:217 (+),score=93.32 TRINITY_DN1126_c2_g4_i1:63-713(+)
MLTRAAALLAAAAAAAAEFGKPLEAEHPPQGGSIGASLKPAAAPPSPRPETEWLTLDALKGMLNDNGFGPVEEEMGRLVLPVTVPEVVPGAEARNMYVEWSDMDSLKIIAAWKSPQKNLEDAPIVNKWNSQRRFCKVSIAPDPESTDGSLLIMHMDQLIFADEGPGDKTAVETVLRRSVDTFRAGVLEFDKFVKDTYKAWAAEVRDRQGGAGDDQL